MQSRQRLDAGRDWFETWGWPLYGFVAPALAGPWEPVNGSGLVLRNPEAEPLQAYSWLVLPDLRVTSFVDCHSLAGREFRSLDPNARSRNRCASALI